MNEYNNMDEAMKFEAEKKKRKDGVKKSINGCPLDQLELVREIIDVVDINIVTCGECGSVVLHSLGDAEITCPYCGFFSDISDFPDFLYD